ncbi:hypothetical protein CWM47_02025 [Spirosoma pollinicola]|uniref:Uncharacterized protein n=2 Tax=Spirosoma pollinicola TaxID=2057025 RepID=A0A2K8YSU5_9BACT|nr:hypothetical protein CWM47_02025 [Spirosoma pollinicola]
MDSLTENVARVEMKGESTARDVTGLTNNMVSLTETVTRVEMKGDSTARAVATLTVSTDRRFDELKAGQVRLEQTQLEILTFLRSKFN